MLTLLECEPMQLTIVCLFSFSNARVKTSRSRKRLLPVDRERHKHSFLLALICEMHLLTIHKVLLIENVAEISAVTSTIAVNRKVIPIEEFITLHT